MIEHNDSKRTKSFEVYLIQSFQTKNLFSWSFTVGLRKNTKETPILRNSKASGDCKVLKLSLKGYKVIYNWKKCKKNNWTLDNCEYSMKRTLQSNKHLVAEIWSNLMIQRIIFWQDECWI